MVLWPLNLGGGAGGPLQPRPHGEDTNPVVNILKGSWNGKSPQEVHTCDPSFGRWRQEDQESEEVEGWQDGSVGGGPHSCLTSTFFTLAHPHQNKKYKTNIFFFFVRRRRKKTHKIPQPGSLAEMEGSRERGSGFF